MAEALHLVADLCTIALTSSVLVIVIREKLDDRRRAAERARKEESFNARHMK